MFALPTVGEYVSAFAKKPRLREKRKGVSLLELVISLAIFSAIVVPMVSMPIKAAEKAEQLENAPTTQLEIQHMFGASIGRDVRRSNSFFPLASTLGPDSKFFVAYYDQNSRKTIRLGYWLYQNKLYQASIKSPQDLLTSYVTVGRGPQQPQWHTLGISGDENAVTLSAANTSGTVRFLYCRGVKFCDPSVVPAEATGLALGTITISGTSPNTTTTIAGVKATLGATKIDLPPLYFKLGANLNTPEEVMKTNAFTTANYLNNLGFKENNSRLMVLGETATNSSFNMGDSYYDNQTDWLYQVGDNGLTSTSKRFYITRSKLGYNNYPGYEMISKTGSAYRNYFPITIRSTDEAWLGANYQFKSLTVDNEGSIFVLATDTASSKAQILAFDSSGSYLGKTDISSNVNQGKAFGITFNPKTPREIIVLVRSSNAGNPLVLQSYVKYLMSKDSEMVKPTAESLDILATANNVIPAGFAIGDDQIAGLDFIDELSTFIITNHNGQIVTVPSKLPKSNDATTAATNFGKPSWRAFFVTPPPPSDNAIITGISFDEDHKQLIENTNTGNVVLITPNINLYTNYQ